MTEPHGHQGRNNHVSQTKDQRRRRGDGPRRQADPQARRSGQAAHRRVGSGLPGDDQDLDAIALTLRLDRSVLYPGFTGLTLFYAGRWGKYLPPNQRLRQG